MDPTLDVNASGTIAVAGMFQGTLQLDPDPPFLAFDQQDGYVARFDSDGTTLGKQLFVGPYLTHCDSVGIDAKGNVIVGGAFQQELMIAGVSKHKAPKTNSYFIAGWPASGSIWADLFHKHTGDLNKWLTELAVHPSGRFAIVIDGDTTTVNLPPTVEPGRVVASFAQDGTPQWGKMRSSDDIVVAVAFDAVGNLIVAGNVWMNANDILLSKYDVAGGLVWDISLHTDSKAAARGIGVTAQGDVLVVGSFEGVLEGQDITAVGQKDAFMTKVSSAGDTMWTRSFGSGGSEWVSRVAVDSLGHIVLGATVSTPVDFGCGPVAANGPERAVIAKLTPLGDCLWSKRVPQGMADLAIAPDGAVLGLTYFMESIQLDDYTLDPGYKVGGTLLFRLAP